MEKLWKIEDTGKKLKENDPNQYAVLAEYDLHFHVATVHLNDGTKVTITPHLQNIIINGINSVLLETGGGLQAIIINNTSSRNMKSKEEVFWSQGELNQATVAGYLGAMANIPMRNDNPYYSRMRHQIGKAIDLVDRLKREEYHTVQEQPKIA